MSLRLLDGARETWSAMLAAIDGARTRIELEVYAFLDHGVGDRFVAALSAAAARGVRVRVRVDAWGSIGSAGRVVECLAAAGCDAAVHNRLRFGFLGRWNRNHRKLLLVDGEVAILGGINIGDLYAEWADAAVELRGPACAVIERRLAGERFVEQAGPVRVFLSRMGGGWRLRRCYFKAFSAARRRIEVAHAYFLPDAKLMRTLARAARRGVEVLLLLPAKSDVPLAHMATTAQYRKLLRAGVRILEWGGGVLHAKLAVVDGQRLLVGSFNLDPFSLANLEALVVADDGAAAADAQAWIARRAAEAHPATAPFRWTWLGRLVNGLLRMFARLMRV
jgi:cardiolipin synthase